MTPSQRERAEAAFGHVQHAATEMILAAHDALDILGEVVATVGLGGFLDRLKDAGGPMTPSPEPASASDPAATSTGPAPRRRVERIPVR